MFSPEYWGRKEECSYTYGISCGFQIAKTGDKAYLDKVKKVKFKKKKKLEFPLSAQLT